MRGWKGWSAVVGALTVAAGIVVWAKAAQKPADPWSELRTRVKAGQATPVEIVRLGEYELSRGETLAAFELGLQARKADANFVGGHHLLGLIYQKTEQVPQAREALTRTVELDPTLLPPRLNLARLELAARQPVRALAVLKDAVAREPQNAEVWYLVGQAQHLRGSPQRAAGSFRQALKLAPDFAEAHAALGGLQLDLGSYQQAVVPLERAYELGERSPLTLINLAIALVAGRGAPADLQRAETLVAESKNPNLPAAQLASGLIHQQKSEFGKAREAYQRVLRATPRHERALYGLSECLRALGDRKGSVETLQRYDRIVKQRQRLRTLEDRLNQEGEKLTLLAQYAIGLYEAEQYQQAVGHFRTWAKKAPRDPEPKKWLRKLEAQGVRAEAAR